MFSIWVVITVGWQNCWTYLWVSLHFRDVKCLMMNRLATFWTFRAEFWWKTCRAWKAIDFTFIVAGQATSVRLVNQNWLSRLARVVVFWHIGFRWGASWCLWFKTLEWFHVKTLISYLRLAWSNLRHRRDRIATSLIRRTRVASVVVIKIKFNYRFLRAGVLKIDYRNVAFVLN